MVLEILFNLVVSFKVLIVKLLYFLWVIWNNKHIKGGGGGI